MPWRTLITSVVLCIGIPVILAQLGRQALLVRGQARLDAALARIGPGSVAALLVTLVLLFAFQGEAILARPLVIAMLAVPIRVQVLSFAGLDPMALVVIVFALACAGLIVPAFLFVQGLARTRGSRRAAELEAVGSSAAGGRALRRA